MNPGANTRDESLTQEALRLLWRSARDPRFGLSKSKRAVAMVRARVIFRGCNLGSRVTAQGPVEVSVQGALSVGDGVNFMAGMVPTRLRVGLGGTLSIGARCVFNYGVSIDAQERIDIGDDCLFGSMVQVADLTGDRRGPVVLGKQVWVAHGVVISPGVRVGDGAVLSAGAVVTQDVPAGHIAIGSPARSMKLSTVAAPR